MPLNNFLLKFNFFEGSVGEVSTKDARQSTERATRDGRLIGEVSEIRSEMVTRHQT